MVSLHLPVMEKEVLQILDCKGGGVYVDATIGDGGHAEIILSNLAPKGLLIGIDWDEAALVRAKKRLSRYADRLILVNDSYTRLEEVLNKTGYPLVDGILVDLGASTLQLMDPERGFSFHQEGDLDMRMDRRRSLTAKDIVNTSSAEQLAEIFFRFGEERWAKRIAARIVESREKEGLFSDSRKLAETVKAAVPARYRRTGGHPSRKVFQALRLAVNHELDNLAALLPQAIKVLSPGGRLCIIAYHSLEDRLVKQFFRRESRYCSCPPDRPCLCDGTVTLKILTARAVKPSEDEIERNPRSRSAKLRAAEKV